jgi:hypothetical protein
MTSPIRNYRTGVPIKLIETSGGIEAGTLTFNINNVDDLPPVPFTLVIEPDVTDKEEVITVTGVSGVQLTVVRGEDGTTATSHNDGVELRHMITARDLQNPRDHIDSSGLVHDLGSEDGDVVGTLASQTLTRKTLTSPSVNGGTLSGVTLTGTINASSATITSYATSANLTTHAALTTSAHGIADTSKLPVIGSTSAGRRISVQATAPTTPAPVTGDIWFQVTGL